ncbi:helix-turn-helix domain-containing protein [Chryseobacterium sp. SIMBA_029]|uniref:helix-turn-helix domain-containing protein n=2 Tax=Bacteria TaxID=2 RepID=UPI00397BD3EE
MSGCVQHHYVNIEIVAGLLNKLHITSKICVSKKAKNLLILTGQLRPNSGRIGQKPSEGSVGDYIYNLVNNNHMENITQNDLRQFRMLLLNDIEKLIDEKIQIKPNVQPNEWLRSKSIREIMNVSPATLQNIRITGKIRFRKVMGSYYYSRTDLLKLFGDGNK